MSTSKLIFFFSVSIISALVLYLSVAAKRKKIEFREVFNSTFIHSKTLPKYEQTWLYGFPHITLIFKEKSELDDFSRSTLFVDFKKKIENVCKSKVNEGNPFNIEKAIFLTCEADLARWKKEGKRYQNERGG